MSGHTKLVKVNPPEPGEYDFQLQSDDFHREEMPVIGYATWEESIPRAEAEANARLWASSPQLLDACRATAEAFKKGLWSLSDVEQEQLYDKVSAALARSEGR